jgi:hypothetical protein
MESIDLKKPRRKNTWRKGQAAWKRPTKSGIKSHGIGHSVNGPGSIGFAGHLGHAGPVRNEKDLNKSVGLEDEQSTLYTPTGYLSTNPAPSYSYDNSSTSYSRYDSITYPKYEKKPRIVSGPTIEIRTESMIQHPPPPQIRPKARLLDYDYDRELQVKVQVCDIVHPDDVKKWNSQRLERLDLMEAVNSELLSKLLIKKYLDETSEVTVEKTQRPQTARLLRTVVA